MSIELKGIFAGVLFLFSIGFGIWLSRGGRPLSTGILTVHKLTALAMIVFAVLAVIQLIKLSGIPSAVLPLVIVFGVSVVALFVTGALLSIWKETNAFVRTVHWLLTMLAAISGTVAACV
ncbi:MAG TPA: hypothetical protein PK854_12510, partial [Oscillospiraceae bacterium]|nr:hypothetical protein [Oscillospiraceae bacterium]HPS36073.1 hypothetical protein [Oscillospiraceae bacterium]